MSTYNLFSLKKGLVDDSAKGKLDDNYKAKCSKLENCFIKPNGNIASRPGLVEQEAFGKYVLDITVKGEKTYVMRKPPASAFFPKIQDLIRANISTRFKIPIFWSITDHSDIYGRFNNTLNWKVIDVYDKDKNRLNEECYLFYSIDSESHIDVVEDYLGSPTTAKRYTESGSITDQEKAIIYRNHTFNSGISTVAWEDSRLLSVSQMISTFYYIAQRIRQSSYLMSKSPAASLDFSTSLGGVDTPEITQYIQKQAVLSNQAGEMGYAFIFKNPYDNFDAIYQGIANIPAYALDWIGTTDYRNTKNLLTDYSKLSIAKFQGDFFQGTNKNFIKPYKSHLSNNLDIAQKFEDREKGAGFTAFGYNYTLDGKLICEHSQSTSFSIDSLNERNMQSFSEKARNINVKELPIQVKQFLPYVKFEDYRELGDIGTVTSVAAGNDYSIADNPKYIYQKNITLESLLVDRPELAEIKNRLDLVLTITNQTEEVHPIDGTLLSILPDIKVTLPGTDVEAVGAHLFTTKNNDHVFVGPQTNIYYNQFKDKDNEDKYKLADQPSQTDAPNVLIDDRFAKGTGGAFGNIGVCLYIQNGNEITKNGVPIFCPIPGGSVETNSALYVSGGSDIITKEVIYLQLDYLSKAVTDIVNNEKYLSFYGSNGSEKCFAGGLVKVGNMQRNDIILGDVFSYNALVLTADVDQTTKRVKQSKILTAERHLFLNMNRDPSQYLLQGAQFVAPKRYIIDETTFPRVFLPNKTQLQNPNTDTDSIRTMIPRFATKQTLNYLKNIEVNNKLYPVVPSGVSLLDNNASIKKLQKVLKELKRKELGATSNYRGYILSYTTRIDNFGKKNKTVYLPAETSFEVNTSFKTDPRIAVLSSNLIKSIEEVTHEYSGSDYPLRVGGSPVPRPHGPRVIVYSVYTYYNSQNITFTDENDDSTQILSKEAPKYIRDYEKRIAGLKDGVKRQIIEKHFFPYSSRFVTYNEPNDIAVQIGDTFVQNKDGSFHFSSSTEDGENIFSVAIRDFLKNTFTTREDPGYLRRSGLTINNFAQLERQNPHSIKIAQKFGKYAKLIGKADVSGKSIIVTDQGGYNEELTKKVFSTGFTSNIVVDSSMIIGGYGDILKVTRFVENAQGFVEDIVNDETKFDGDIVSVAGLLEKHKLVFIVLKEPEERVEKTLYILSLSNNRGINGLSKIIFPSTTTSIEKVIQLDEDRILILDGRQRVAELDFSFSDEDLSDKGLKNFSKNYTTKIQPLPLVKLKGDSISLDENITISKAVVGLNGDPEFKFSVINSLTKAKVYANIKHTDPLDVTNVKKYAGQLMIDNIPANGSELPEILIEKNNGKYFELSSIILILGEY